MRFRQTLNRVAVGIGVACVSACFSGDLGTAHKPAPGESTDDSVGRSSTVADRADLVPGAAANTVGALEGNFDVGQAGDASYVIPLDVLNGTSDIGPQLSLVYNSSGADSDVGVGWSLGGGQSVISRCAAAIEPDGFPDGVDWDEHDRFCLDGQRLVAISGAYGANGTEYRTEIESYARVISYGAVAGGPERFLVSMKNGQIAQYGYTADSRVEPVLVPPTGAVVPVAAWAMNRVEDRLGNYMTFAYDEVSVNDGQGNLGVQLLLRRIDYTGNAAAGLAPYASVRLEYEARPDIQTTYQSGTLSVLAMRLKRIANYKGETLSRAYQLTHTNNAAVAGRSQLTSVQECGADGTCLPATTFGMTTAPRGVGGTATIVMAASIAGPGKSNKSDDGRHEAFADVDGDGDQDRVWIPAGDSVVYVSLWRGTFFDTATPWLSGPLMNVSDWGRHEAWLDMNSDGKADRVWIPLELHDIYVALSTGTSFAAPTIWLPDGAVPGLRNYSTQGLHETFADINGDALLDRIWTPEGTEGTVRTYLALNTGGSFGTPKMIFPLHDGLYNTSEEGRYEQYIDLDGDGLVDYTWIPKGGTSTYASLSNNSPSLTDGIRFDPPTVWLAEDTRPPLDSLLRVNFREYADVNGDDLPDLIFYKVNGTCGEIRVAVNTGKALLPSRVFATSCAGAVPLASLDARYQHFVDMNDDDRADHVWIPSDRSTLWIAYGDGKSFGAPQELISAGVGVSPRSLTESYYDADGDGSIDRVWIPDTAPNGRFYMVSGNRVSHRVDSITDGQGHQIKITYDTLQNPNVYTKDTNAVFPLLDLAGPSVVVSATNIGDGIGGFRTYTYRYEGLKMHLRGLGNLGMRRMVEAEGAKPVATVSDISQDWTQRLQGMTIMSASLHRKVDALPTDPFPAQLVAVNTVTNRYEVGVVNTATGTIYVPRIAESTTEDRDLYNKFIARRKTENLVVDAYGNTTSSRVSVSDEPGALVSQATFAMQYDNDAAAWSLGLLKRSEATRTAPSAVPAVPAITRVTAQTWDVAKRLLMQEVVEPNVPELKVTKDHTYNAFGNRTKTTTSASGITTRTLTTTYDATGRFATESTNALGRKAKTQYNQTTGLLESETDAGNLVTTYAYDAFGRQTLETRPDSTKTRTSRLPCDARCPPYAVHIVATEVDFQAPFYQYLDALGRELRKEATSLDGRVVLQDTAYDTFGRSIRVSEPYFAGETPLFSMLTYDTLDRAIRDQGADGAISSVDYRANKTTYTDELGQTRVEATNALGQVVEVTNAQSNRMFFRYDAFGSVIEANDGLNYSTKTTYDRLGRKIASDDPDKGRGTYVHDALGQMIQQTDAKGQIQQTSFDVLGRPVYRRDHDGMGTSWVYDTAANGIGKVARLAQANCGTQTMSACLTTLQSTREYVETPAYDTLGRPTKVSTVIANETFDVSNTYDAQGRIDVITYPAAAGAPLKIRNVYNAAGHLAEVKNATSNANYWKVTRTDARGNFASTTLGNGLVADRDYDAATGLLKAVRTGPPGTPSVQNLGYQFDAVGNLKARYDYAQGISEVARYDSLNRITNIDTQLQSATRNVFAAYDTQGNVVLRSDVGDYGYGGTCNGQKAGPHAVTTTGPHGDPNPTTYCYDANGNAVLSGNRNIQYSTFDKPTRITQGTNETTFAYGPSRAKYRRVDNTAAGTVTTTYVGGIYERSVSATGTTHRAMIGDFAVVTLRQSPQGAVTTNVRYLHRDHLGSVDAVTNEAGGVVERLSFDAWGQRRNPDWSQSPNPGALASQVTLRGFTGHEQVDTFNLVHMDGRVYDPAIGKFLSADPFVQAPNNFLSYNRYAYVLDNPMSYTDPSGYLFSGAREKIKRIGRKLKSYHKRQWRRTTRPDEVWERLFNRSPVRVPKEYSPLYQGYQAYRATGSASDGFKAAGKSYLNLVISAAASWAASYAAPAVANFFGTEIILTKDVVASGVLTDWKFNLKQIGASIAGGAGLQAVSTAATAAVNGENIGRAFRSGAITGAIFGALEGGNRVMRAWRLEKSLALAEKMAIKVVPGEHSSGGFFRDGWGNAGVGPTWRVEPCSQMPMLYQSTGPLGADQMGQHALFGWEYEAGSMLDWVLEGFSNPHDQLSSRPFYDELGANRLNPWGGSIDKALGREVVGYTISFTLLAPALPFAAPTILPRIPLNARLKPFQWDD